MKRQIIKIDEAKCNGCGACVTGCPEGAIQLVNGKAKVVNEVLCDGLGACIGECPQGAITIEEREAMPYSERLVIENIVKEGEQAVRDHLTHLKSHGQHSYFMEAMDYLRSNNIAVDISAVAGHQGHGHGAGGCPGSKMLDMRALANQARPQDASNSARPQSRLANWPVQLKLLNPDAPYLKGAELLISADCAPFAFANFHERFLKGKVLIMFCPKLDEDLDGYVEKLAHIFSTQDIKSVSIVRMEVPCCGGVERLVTSALNKSGRHILMKEYTISIGGEIV